MRQFKKAEHTFLAELAERPVQAGNNYIPDATRHVEEFAGGIEESSDRQLGLIFKLRDFAIEMAGGEDMWNSLADEAIKYYEQQSTSIIGFVIKLPECKAILHFIHLFFTLIKWMINKM